MLGHWRSKLASSPAAPILAAPYRFSLVGAYELERVRVAAHWLIRSRELTNFTYDLTPLNRLHLAWFVSGVTGESVERILGYFAELEGNRTLACHIEQAVRRSRRRFVSDAVPRYGRRLGWYALVRALRPLHVLETGCDKGLGTLVLASALRANGCGRVTTIDVNPNAGILFAGHESNLIDFQVGSSVEVIQRGSAVVDFFIHDSLHTRSHELAEFRAVESRLSASGLVLSDNAHASTALPCWAAETSRQFCFFGEKPANHWYPGDGIGVALKPRPGLLSASQ